MPTSFPRSGKRSRLCILLIEPRPPSGCKKDLIRAGAARTRVISDIELVPKGEARPQWAICCDYEQRRNPSVLFNTTLAAFCFSPEHCA
jgi:hypothetical protein